jgi:hypothetical protein
MEEALSNAGILQYIFSYEGPGSWLFISPVCKLWKELYEQLNPAPLQASYPHANIHTTAFECVFQSPSRLRLACEHGLQAYFATELLQLKAGLRCDVPTLLAAQELGLQVSDSLISCAAGSGRLDVLQLLHVEQGMQLPANVSNGAAALARVDVLLWLRRVGYAFNTDTANAAAACNQRALLQWLLEQQFPVDQMMLCGTAIRYGHMSILSLLQERGLLPAQRYYGSMLQLAGAYGHLAVAQWLRQRGAEWPPLLKYCDKPWSGTVLEWVRVEGVLLLLKNKESSYIWHLWHGQCSAHCIALSAMQRSHTALCSAMSPATVDIIALVQPASNKSLCSAIDCIVQCMYTVQCRLQRWHVLALQYTVTLLIAHTTCSATVVNYCCMF